MAEIFDLFDQATLTTTREDGPFLGATIAPEKDIPSRVARIRVYDTVAFGLGQFKAPDGTPPLFKGQTSYQEKEIELLQLEEMERIDSEDWIKLHSNDDTLRRTAGLGLVERGRVLQLRNDRLAEWMRWQAFRGEMTVTYPTGQQLWIDYGIPVANKPTAGTLWTDTTNADPLADLIAWSELIASQIGHFGTRVHMTLKCFQYLVKNAKIKALVNFYSPRANEINLPRETEMLQYVRTFLPQFNEFVIYDNGYRAEGTTGAGWPGSITKYLPDTHVLMTTDYSLDGVPIAETLNGLVEVGDDPGEESQILMGPQSEILFDHIGKVHLLRQAAARIPRLNTPEAFVWAKVAN